MRVSAVLGLSVAIALIVVPISAQTPPAPAKLPVSDTQVGTLATIRQTAVDFEKAFNQGDAAAVASLWTEDGEYVDEGGQSFKGRKAIQDEYEKMLAVAKGRQIRIVIDSLTLTSDKSATEMGRAMLEPATVGAPAYGAYTVTHAKVNDKWLMSKVVDGRVETESTYTEVADLDWLIGTWVGEENGVKTESICRWVCNKSFVQRTYTVTALDQTTTSGVQMIGFNPQGGHVQSWNFSPGGGYAVGTWWPQENGWKAETHGTLADGQISSSTVLLTRLDDDAYAWQSIHRSVNGQALPDTDEIVIKRQSN